MNPLPRPAAIPAASSAGRPARVMVVDDSLVVRGLLARWLDAADGVEVVGTAADGRLALELLPGLRPDIVLLDLDMPELDGFATLPLMLRERPDVSVIVVSTLTRRNAEASLRCLRLGAVDCITKPEVRGGTGAAGSFPEEIVAKVRGVATRHRRLPRTPPGAAPSGLVRAARPSLLGGAGRRPVRAILIGASTGGPAAIAEVLRGLRPVPALPPVLIAQHMPPIFTSVLAEQLAEETGFAVTEAAHGEAVSAGRVYVAPGGRHMGLGGTSRAVTIRLDDGPAIHHCRPALDVLFRDAAALYGAGALALTLTGMGHDGTEGARALVKAGASVLVQDRPTSIVWGMPGSIAEAGLASAVLPLGALAGAVESALPGRPA